MFHRTLQYMYSLNRKQDVFLKHDPCRQEVWLDIFISRDPGHNPGVLFFVCLFVWFFLGGGVKFCPKWWSGCRTIKSYTVNQRQVWPSLSTDQHEKYELRLQVLSQFMSSSLKSIQWLHGSKSCVQIGNKCDNLSWKFEMISKFEYSLATYVYIIRFHAQSGMWPLKKTIIKTWA